MVLKTLLVLGLSLIASPAFCFVLLSGAREARLPVSLEQPVLTFLVSPSPPPIYEKDEFAAGASQLLSDSAYWLALIRIAMGEWNNVNGSYLELRAELGDGASLDGEDGVNSIVASSTNLTTSAYAKPELSDALIADCDIAVSERGSRAESLAFTLMHELGHCLGLGHNHSDYKAAMSYARESRDLELGLDDEAGLIYLYPDATVKAPRELISCGTLGVGGASSGLNWLLFALPLLPGLVFRARKKALRGDRTCREFEKSLLLNSSEREKMT